MKCPKCEFEIIQDANFCSNCAYDLRERRENLKKGDHHPQSYTPKFLADKILSSRSAIEGERKHVTVLFADVANYTSISEKLDPEDTHQIMDGCFHILMDEIHGHQGIINQFTGDGVMALFGAPLALEDHERKACQAALAIQEAMKRYGEELKIQYRLDFKMRVGINSGSVMVGSIGDDLRMDYTAIGDTTNLAARMESLARPGKVLISSNTYKRVSSYFEIESLGKVKLKGKEETLDAYKLIGKKTDIPMAGLERQIYSEMVGRDEDLNKLELQVMKAVTGEGSVVNIIGEAGIGKSRLMAELKQCRVMKKVVLLEGKAISMGKNLSFHPVISLLKHWARIKEADHETAAFGKLETTTRNLCQQEADEIIPFVATLMGMKLTGRYAERVKGIEGEALQKLIMKNVRDLLVKATEITPMVIVMEDLHWADTSSIELLESLLRMTETQRIVFVNVFRPGHKETGDRIIETTKERASDHYVEISLRPLNAQNSEILINNMLNIKGLYHKVKDKVIKRSGGNPFFIEEVVRSFIDEGAVVKKNGTFEVTEKIDTVVIPQTINDVLMARIDRLEEDTRNLVKIASVIGRNFFYSILTDVAAEIADIHNRLEYLKATQLIREHMRMEEIEYLFKHALMQEAAYESILLQKRKELHLKVADSIERVFKERLHEFYGMLAFHYSRGEDEDKAEDYLIKAGEEALKSSASSEALYYYQEALHLYIKKFGEAADPEKTAMLEKNIGTAFFNKGQHVEAVEYINRVLAYHGENEFTPSVSGFLKLFIRSLYFLAGLYVPFLRWRKTPTKRDSEISYLALQRGECLSTIDPKKMFLDTIIQSKRAISLDIAHFREGLKLFLGISGIFSYSGVSFKVSRKALDIVGDHVKNDDFESMLAYKLHSLIHGYLSGDLETEHEYDDMLVEKNLRIGEYWNAWAYITFQIYSKTEMGGHSDVWDMIHKLSEIGNLYNHKLAAIQKYHCNAHVLIKNRKFQDAIVEVNEGIDIISKTDSTLFLFWMYSFKALLQILMGDVKGAENTLESAGEIRSEIQAAPMQVRVFLLSSFLVMLFRLEESLNTGVSSEIATYKINALKAGKKAVKNSQKVVFDRVEVYRCMGIYHWLINRQKKALHWWARSMAEGERLRARVELSRTYYEVGKRLLESKSKHKMLNSIKAEEYLDKAKEMFKDMDLQWDLDELERVAVSFGQE